MALQGGDRLARGAKSAQFSAGTTHAGDEVQINPGVLAPEEGPREDIVIEPIDRTRSYKKLTPKRDQILVQRRAPENISAGGLIIPDEGKDRPSEGTIMQIGPKVEDLKEGDHIIFGKYAGTEYPWGTETLLFMREEEVIATVEE